MSPPIGGGGGGDEAEIKKLKAELQIAIENEEFEKCAAIKKKIKKIESRSKSHTVAPTFDQAGYDKALKFLQEKMSEHISKEEYEACAPLRDKKKELEKLKKEWEQSGGNKGLEQKLKKIIRSCDS